MIISVVLTLEQQLSGNAFMTAILSSQIVMNVVNATIVGGVYELTSWLPAVYLQVRGLIHGIIRRIQCAILICLASIQLPKNQSQMSSALIRIIKVSYFH